MPIVLGSIHEREACQRDSALLQGCLIVVSGCAFGTYACRPPALVVACAR